MNQFHLSIVIDCCCSHRFRKQDKSEWKAKFGVQRARLELIGIESLIPDSDGESTRKDLSPREGGGEEAKKSIKKEQKRLQNQASKNARMEEIFAEEQLEKAKAN